MAYELIDGKPVPAALGDELRELKRITGATLNSCLRTQDAVNFARRAGFTLSSQAELYNGFVHGLPGFNPANPPGRSTHELRSDGVAFAGPMGRKLPYWEVGQDWSDAPAIVRAASQRRWTATVTYPGNPREGHHVNFRKKPVLRLWRSLKMGSRGPRVLQLARRLKRLGYLTKSGGTFSVGVEHALKRYQREHHQRADGVYGVQTHRQLVVSIRQLNKRKAER